jgi:hypothetical protein
MSSCCSERQWIIDRINATRALIIIYEGALDAFAMGAQTYSIDTGQTRQTVSKQQLGSVQLTLTRLEARLAAYQQRLCGTVSYMRPAW